MSNRKTSLKIIRNDDGSCSIQVSFSDKDKLLHNDNKVLRQLLVDASSPEFYNFVVKESEVKP
jgi:hypothetical protein